VRTLDASALHASLAAHALVEGEPLNVEGMAVHLDGTVTLFHRANHRGSTHDVAFQLEAAALWSHWVTEGSPPPPVRAAFSVLLGQVHGARLTVTDACARPGGGLWLCAAAEDTDNAVDDGVVRGSCVAVMRTPGEVETRPLVWPDGAPWAGKPEGVCLQPGKPGRAWLVVDDDDPHVPARLLDVDLGGP
jgi:hypothetical protein